MILRIHHKILYGLSCLLISWSLLLLVPSAAQADSARSLYIQAEVCYKNLRSSPKKQKYRDKWLACIEKFEDVYRRDPSGPWAAAGLYMSGKLYQGLYRHSYKPSDQNEARDIFERIVKRYPSSRYRKKAEVQLFSVSRPSESSGKKMVDSVAPATGKHARQTREQAASDPASAPKPGNVATVEGLRFWSNPNYTRIVVDVNDETTYSHKLLKEDPALNKPQRLYVDLDKSRLGDVNKALPINDDLLRGARAGQYLPDSVRVVVDIKSFDSYKIFPLKNPFRIVIDVRGKEEKALYAAIAPAPNEKKVAGSTLAQQLALGVSKIVIDPGHGGRDFGAPGYLKGIHEKDIVLRIAHKLADKIRTELRCEVVMTRKTDKYLTLEERTAIANTQNADLFISIHTNASRNRKAYGIETFFLNLATDDEAILVAARENATSTKNISDLQSILNDLMQNAKINESSRLASRVQNSLFSGLKGKYASIKSKGVKQAPFYVLLGAEMPAILVETAFISNARECKRLLDAKYQERLCDGIVKGVQKYIQETNPTAFLRQRPQFDSRG